MCLRREPKSTKESIARSWPQRVFDLNIYLYFLPLIYRTDLKIILAFDPNNAPARDGLARLKGLNTFPISTPAPTLPTQHQQRAPPNVVQSLNRSIHSPNHYPAAISLNPETKLAGLTPGSARVESSRPASETVEAVGGSLHDLKSPFN